MRIINRTSIGIDVRGFQLDHQHVYIPRSKHYHLGKKFGELLELGGFTPQELRHAHEIIKLVELMEGAEEDLPPEFRDKARESPSFKALQESVAEMRRQVEKLPPLELLEQLEHEEEDGFYLYPKARGFDPITGLVL